jgi:hypothetical protein
MLRKIAITAASTLIMVAGTFGGLWAQDADASKPAQDGTKVLNAYRLDFLLSELEDGKKINSRQYSMNSRSGDGNEIKIGTRVPVEVKEHEMQYLDVGINICCRLRDQTDVGAGMSSLGNSVLLNVRAEISNIVPPEPGHGESATPPVRQVKIEASTIGMPGRPLTVGTVDDPNSKRQYQLEVTVTKIK